MTTKYLVYCKHCGNLLLKTRDPFIRIFTAEIKCPACKKLLNLPEDSEIVLNKRPNPGLES